MLDWWHRIRYKSIEFDHHHYYCSLAKTHWKLNQEFRRNWNETHTRKHKHKLNIKKKLLIKKWKESIFVFDDHQNLLWIIIIYFFCMYVCFFGGFIQSIVDTHIHTQILASCSWLTKLLVLFWLSARIYWEKQYRYRWWFSRQSLTTTVCVFFFCCCR